MTTNLNLASDLRTCWMCDQNRFLLPVDTSARIVHCHFGVQRILHGAQAPLTWRKYRPLWIFQCFVIWQSLGNLSYFLMVFGVSPVGVAFCSHCSMACRYTERNVFNIYMCFGVTSQIIALSNINAYFTVTCATPAAWHIRMLRQSVHMIHLICY